MSLTKEFVRSLPKVLLHDHLDGGLRPQTVIELAEEQGYTKLPTHDAKELNEWFQRGAQRGSLPLYLEGFDHTCALMQSESALERVAYETLEDMKNDGVVYLETRFAPLFHIAGGLTLEQVVLAVLRGLERGKTDFGVCFGLILVALRHMDPVQSLLIAKLAVQFRTEGVVGFDCAGAENGYPAKEHVEAFRYVQHNNFNITIHAGEGFGKESIYQALQHCGAHRIGHCTKIIEDMIVHEGVITDMGPLAQYILDKRIPLEMCLTSNLHTGTISALKDHPFKLLHDYNFRVTLNTDDRLMSGITLSDEYFLAHDMFHLTLRDLQKIAVNSMKSAFISYRERGRIIDSIVRPGFKAAEERLIAQNGLKNASELDDLSTVGGAAVDTIHLEGLAV